MNIRAYGDGRIWDDSQRARVNDILNTMRGNLDEDSLALLRQNSLWLQDILFPTGFTYTVNHGPSEAVHGGWMEGEER